MHEMAIAEGILDIALDYAKKNEAKKITCVALKIGEMAGIEREALEFSWRILVKKTIAEDAELKIHLLPLVGKCQKCGAEIYLEEYDFFCPQCKDGILELISGRELQVEYLEVDD